MMEQPEVVENFFGVYLLYSMNEKYKGRTYIGYTVDPNRRLKQHNAGAEFGGAYRTSKRGPWKMILIVHGFPSSTPALTFEWAWQHPGSSRRLKHVKPRKSKQKVFDYRLMVLSEMLNVEPWCNLQLIVRFFDDDFYMKYRYSISPPMHMPITHGPVISKKLKENAKNRDKRVNQVEAGCSTSKADINYCIFCDMPVEAADKITCVQPECSLVAHILCLGKSFSKDDGMLLPVDGTCPFCDTNVLWGDLIRKRIGCDLQLKNEFKSPEKAEEEVILIDDDDDDSDFEIY